jgi:magnesium chelatase subunit D
MGEGDDAAPSGYDEYAPVNDSYQNAPADSKQGGPRQAPRRVVPVGDTFKAKRLDTKLDRMTRSKGGRRSTTRTDRKRGRYIKARPVGRERASDIAFDATLREAAVHQAHRQRQGVAFAIERQDLRKKVRVRRASNLILFVVDASWSMAASERMEATKGAVMSLLVDAYQRRDQVGMIVFQRDRARVVLPPTNSVELAEKALRDIPVGGKTPLSSGLLLAYNVIMAARRRDPETRPIMVLLTDGAGNVSMTGMPAQEEAMRMAELFKHAKIRTITINMEHEAFDRGLAKKLAQALGGSIYNLPELRADSLVKTVESELAWAK